MKRTLIAVLLLLSACTQQPDLISITGLSYVLTNLDKTNIDEYLLGKGYTFNQQYVEPEDQSYFPKPLRHVYQNASTKTTLAVAYFGVHAFEIRVGTNDPNIYLNLKTEAVKSGYVIKNTGEQTGITWMHYILPGMGINMTFEQRSASYSNKYVMIFSNNKIGNEAAKAILKDMAKANAASNTIGNIDSVRSVTATTDTAKSRLSHIGQQGAATFKVFSFPASVLYPSDGGANLDTNHFVVNGVITDANFDSGAFRVKTTDGEPLDIQFYTDDASSATKNDLRLALKPGNRIKSICARAGAATLDLYSAKIYVPSNK